MYRLRGSFTPLFQEQLTQHISRLPQAALDKCSESELMAMMEKDVAALDAVVSAWFDLISSTLELSLLVPILFILSLELSFIVSVITPIFVILQLRAGKFIVGAAHDVRMAEMTYMRMLEENIVFAATRKTMGFGRVFDFKMRMQRVEVVDKFDLLDQFEAKSQLQVDTFSFALASGVFACGAMLMNFVVDENSVLTSVQMPEGCFFIHGDDIVRGDECGDAQGNTRYRIDLSTLFAYFAAVQELFPICMSLIGCVRKIQVGISSYERVKRFIQVDREPWADHAVSVQEQKQRATGMNFDGAELVELSLKIDRKLVAKGKKFGVKLDGQATVTRVFHGGFAIQEGGLKVGDRVLEIDGHIMDGQDMNPIKQPIANSEGSQVSTALAEILSREPKPPRRVHMLVLRTLPPETLTQQEEEAAQLKVLGMMTNGDLAMFGAVPATPPPLAANMHHASTQTRKADYDQVESTSKELESVPESTPFDHPKDRDDEEGRPPAIVVSNVNFGYDAARNVLEGVSFIIPEGAKVGILGRSGDGKSTLLKLLARVYQPHGSGRIRFFNEPINEVVLEDKAVFMNQAPVLYDASVHENIIVGLDEDSKVPSDEEAVQDACLSAHLWHEVPTLGGGLGLQAPVGYRGKKLTGGQAQRVVLARCLLRQTPILFLDEPVSAQDDQSVNTIAEVMSELHYPERNADGTIIKDGAQRPATVVAVTHNHAFLKSFTHAMMLMHGRVVEFGAIEDLMRRKGHYYRQIMSRTGLTVDGRGQARCTPERLRQVWLFATAPLEALEKLASKFVTLQCATGDKIYEKGTDAASMYFLAKGQVEAVEFLGDEEDGGNGAGGGEGGDGAKQLGSELDANPSAVKKNYGKRYVYMSGEDFGVEGLLDNAFSWNMHARVASRKAVLLELSQTDMEDAIKQNPGLKDTTGTMLDRVHRLRAPKSLALLWAFYGAPTSCLMAVSETLTPEIMPEGGLLCEPPMDPLQSLVIVVTGKIALLRAGGASDGVETVTSGDFFGEYQFLPRFWKAGSTEEALFSARSPVQRAKATEFTVMLQLPRTKLAAIMDKDWELQSTVQNNLRRWTNAVQPAYLENQWLLAACPTEVLSLMMPLWRISAVPEGHMLVDGAAGSWGGTELCCILLDGTADVTTRNNDSSERVESVGAGAFINALALISTVFDLSDGRPAEFGETVRIAQITSPSALILTIPSAAFKQCIQQHSTRRRRPTAEAEDDCLTSLQDLASSRVALLTGGALAAGGLVPEHFKDFHHRQLADGGSTVALRHEGDTLFDVNAPPGSRGGMRRGIGPAQVLPARKASNDGHCFYHVLLGSLTVKTENGTQTLRKGETLCTLLPTEIAALIGTTDRIHSSCSAAWVAQGPCVVHRLDLSGVIHSLKNAEEAERAIRAEREAALKAQKARSEMMGRILETRHRVIRLEMRLGMRKRRDPRVLWSWATQTVIRMISMGRKPGPGARSPQLSGADATAAASTLEETIRNLDERLVTLNTTATDRERRLREALSTWEGLQPPLLPEESLIHFRTETYLLTLERVMEAEHDVNKLTDLRQGERDQLLEQLPHLFDEREREDLLARTSGIGHDALKLLSEESKKKMGALAASMAEVQTILRAIWGELQLPESYRAKYRWTTGMPLVEPQVDACKEELKRLYQCQEILKAMGLKDDDPARSVAGETLGSMLDLMEKERVSHATGQAELKAAKDEGEAALTEALQQAQAALEEANIQSAQALAKQRARFEDEVSDSAATAYERQRALERQITEERDKRREERQAHEAALDEMLTDNEAKVGKVKAQLREAQIASRGEVENLQMEMETLRAESRAGKRRLEERPSAPVLDADTQRMQQWMRAGNRGANGVVDDGAGLTPGMRVSSIVLPTFHNGAFAGDRTVTNAMISEKARGMCKLEFTVDIRKETAEVTAAHVRSALDASADAESMSPAELAASLKRAENELNEERSGRRAEREAHEREVEALQTGMPEAAAAQRMEVWMQATDIGSANEPPMEIGVGTVVPSLSLPVFKGGAYAGERVVTDAVVVRTSSGRCTVEIPVGNRTERVEVMSAQVHEALTEPSLKPARRRGNRKGRAAAARPLSAALSDDDDFDDLLEPVVTSKASSSMISGASSMLAKMLGSKDNSSASAMDYKALLRRRRDTINEACELLKSIDAGNATISAFLDQMKKDHKTHEEATKADMKELKKDVADAEATTKRVRDRFDREGLHLRLKSLLKSKDWDAIAYGHALAERAGDGKPTAKSKIPLERFKAFLDEHGVAYTNNGLSFVLSHAGSRLEAAQPIAVAGLVNAIGNVPEKPLYLTLLPPDVAAEADPIARWNSRQQKQASAKSFVA